MLFDKEDFSSFDPIEDLSSLGPKLEQAKSFAKYLISNPTVITSLGIEEESQIKLLENLIYWHEKEELFEICQELADLKTNLLEKNL